jgi:sigma-B regulation protein RsbU (phosphoserine phosphatase)
MNILIVEDDPVARIVLRKSLLVMAHTVTYATNGNTAWDLYAEHQHQCVISDWMMPQLNGLELCQKIRNDGKAGYTYFILLTARTKKEDYLTGMNAGADDFLTKPVDNDQLFARLRVAERILQLKDHVKKLETLLPICSYCKDIRHENGAWEDLEQYMVHQTNTKFSHGVCPSCYEHRVKAELKKMGAGSD